MSKKILLLVFFLFFAVFVPATKVDAATAHVYVGVQVQTATAPGYNSVTDSNWCLPIGTQITILGPGCSANSTGGGTTGTCSNVAAVSNSGTNTTNSILSPACAAGNTIWSGLLNLTTSTNYAVKLYTPSFCPGTVHSYYFNACWVAAANKSCSEMCAYYGLTSYGGTSCTNDNFSDSGTHCNLIQGLKGSPCTTCNAVAGTNYNYYNSSTGDCYYTAYGTSNDCNALGSGLVRACACNYTGGSGYFYFSFATPASF